MTRLAFMVLALGACIGSDQLARRQYEADYQQAVQQCGHPDAAFQDGYNAGVGGRHMHGDWTTLCTPDVRAQTAASYQDGFLHGAQHAPIQIQVTAPARRVLATAPAASTCTFDSDCGGGGYHCRTQVCMGNGYAGDSCMFNADCLNDHCFGGSCRE